MGGSRERTYVGRSVLQKAQRNLAVLFRTCFTTIWRSKIHTNLQVDADALNKRRCRFLLRCTSYLSRTVKAMS